LSADGTLGKEAEPTDGDGNAWTINLDYADFSATFAIELEIIGDKPT
jgi:hypothetical protein